MLAEILRGRAPRLATLLLAVLFSAHVYAETVQIQILHTTDIHSHFLPEEGSRGSYLQLGHLIHAQLDRFGRDKSLLIDSGDTIQGTLVASISGGQAGIDALLSMNYDVWVPGNHEFDFGLDKFWNLTAPLKPITLCGNLHPVEGEDYASWRMFERGGARIAVIGATASYMRNWIIGDMDAVCHVETAVAMLDRILPEIVAQKPDMIVLAIHQGILQGLDVRNVNEVLEISKKYPEIDLILGGHTHLDIAGRKLGARTWYVQPGAESASFGIVTVSIDTEEHKVTDIQSFLRFADLEETPFYPPMEKALRKWIELADEKASQVVCPELLFTISPAGTPGISCQVSELIARALADAAGADCALHGVLSEKTLEAGKPVLFKDIYELIPFENQVIEAWVTPEELAEIALEQWSRRAGYSYSGLYGAVAEIVTSSEDATSVITGIGLSKEKPDPARRYKLVLNSFTAAGSGRYPKLREILERPEVKMKKTSLAVRDVVAEYLKKHAGEPLQPIRWIFARKASNR